MSRSTKSTTAHEEIKRWAETGGGRPTIVKGAERRGKGGGLLRIDFVGGGEGEDPSLEPVSWNEFFRTFGEKDPGFLYQDKTTDGKESRFFKFVNRE